MNRGSLEAGSAAVAERPASGGALHRILPLLRCPATGRPLRLDGDRLAAEGGTESYPVTAEGVPFFAAVPQSDDSARQRAHYDRVAAAYVANLDYPHTRAYGESLDDAALEAAGSEPLGAVLEVCCGRGEAFALLGSRIETGIGVDISGEMLRRARAAHDPERFAFLQGDATRLPLAGSAIDTVVMFGGVHHVNDRAALFAEIARVLKPGGRFLFREPLSDFWPWRILRKIIYTLSPALDAKTERPLTTPETVPILRAAGLELESWKTYGFLGFCFFMNSHVLVFNRAFRFVPGIRALTRAAVALDRWTLRLPGLSGAGLQVVGAARKPAEPEEWNGAP